MKLTIRQAAAFHVLDILESWQLPGIATDALELGLDSPALRELAGEINPDAFNCEPLFERVLAELGIEMPSRKDAELVAARYFSTQILAGEMTPYEGARAIWQHILNYSGDSPNWNRLSLFIGLASEYEDNPKFREEYDQEIIEAAQELVRLVPEP